jgi:16S rRNA C967 or C1407 C5-methylase (RsmB/RsmF family)
MGRSRQKKNTSSVSDKGVSRNIQKVADRLFQDLAEREAFLAALTQGASQRSISWLIDESQRIGCEFGSLPKAEWVPAFVDVVDPEKRPGNSEAHERGDFYCLDLSSVFACTPLQLVPHNPDLLVDVCAAPGGKGIVGWRTLKPRVILANEVIRKRTAQLISNYKRCSIQPAAVGSSDPKFLAESIPDTADVVIVDAPCSGQSLVAKDLAAPGAFHPATISANAQRQRRILANSSVVVGAGGHLLYSTCTFSPEENEETLEWFLRRFSSFQAVEIPTLNAHRSRLSEIPCYRLLPHEGFGAGAFCALLKREGEKSSSAIFCLNSLAKSVYCLWRSDNVAPTPPIMSDCRSFQESRRYRRR